MKPENLVQFTSLLRLSSEIFLGGMEGGGKGGKLMIWDVKNKYFIFAYLFFNRFPHLVSLVYYKKIKIHFNLKNKLEL